MLLEVRNTSGIRVARTVPSSGIDTWYSERISSSRASVSSSTRSTSSTSSTTGSRRADRLEQRAGEEELLGEDVLLELLPRAVRVGLDSQQLLLVVPLVERLRLVEPLVTLEADQPAAGQARDRLGQLGLAGAGRPFDEDRLGQPIGQEDHPGDAVVGQIVDPGKPLAHLVDRTEPGRVGDRVARDDLLGPPLSGFRRAPFTCAPARRR